MSELRLVGLSIPPEAEFVSVARLVVSSLAADRYELDDDKLDSLKLAVSEACVLAIESHNDAPVTINCVEESGRLDVRIGSVANPDSSEHHSPGLPFIDTLVDETAVEAGPDGSKVLRMTVFCELSEQL